MNVVTQKLDLGQTPVVHTHTETSERNKCDKTRGHIVIVISGLGDVDCTSWLRVGTEIKNIIAGSVYQ